MMPADFFARAVPSAIAGGHIWPGYAVCEAALESAWGESELARRANNLFGQKQGQCTRSLPTIELPTKEWQNGALVPTTAVWPIFPDWATSFSERMDVLYTLADSIAAYASALAQLDGAHFVIEVSRAWSTDPRRAANVLIIHADHAPLIERLLDEATAGNRKVTA